MIVDAHTHIFPSSVRDERDRYLERDATFRELYSSPKAQIATAEELLVSMDEAGIDVSVACGFAWSDGELCREHNAHLLDAAARSGGRIVPFCTVRPSGDTFRDDVRGWAALGAHGLGELRPLNQGYGLVDSDEADLLAWAADAYDLPLMFHASEPVGHPYAGKAGLPVEQLYRFIADFPGVTVIAAHWGGGLPFYALMPEVREALAQTYFDTAATGLLYTPDIYATVSRLVGPDRILFGSDYPLVSQERTLREVRDAPIGEDARRLVLGENARRLLRLPGA